MMDSQEPPTFSRSGSFQEESYGATRSHPDSGETSEDVSPDSIAAKKLWADIQVLALQLKPLLRSFLHYAKARAELSLFTTRELARLVAARFFIWSVAILMITLSWIFFSMFLWRAAISLSGEWAAGPFVLLVVHGLAAWALLSWQKRFEL